MISEKISCRLISREKNLARKYLCYTMASYVREKFYHSLLSEVCGKEFLTQTKSPPPPALQKSNDGPINKL